MDTIRIGQISEGFAAMTVDWTLDLNTIVTIILLVGAIVAFIFKVGGGLNKVTNRLEGVEAEQSVQNKQLERLTDLVSTVAAQDARMDGHERRITRLESQMDHELKHRVFEQR